MKRLLAAAALAACSGMLCAQSFPLNGAMVHALADQKVQQRLAELGLDLASRKQQTPEGLAAFHKAEIDKWWPVIRAAGIKVE